LVVTLKVKTQGVAKESYATGDINIIPFVANYVTLHSKKTIKKSKPVGLLLIYFINTNN